jgi:dolichol-phosphate hexosyltransferase
VPVYNEAPTVEQAIAEILSADLGVPFELIIVDDGSTDGTREWLRRRPWPEHVRVLEHDRNRGKGVAVRTALAAARGEVSAIFDADLEYEPSDLRDVIAPVLAGRTDAAFGVRAFDGYSSHSFLYVMGNRLIALAADVLFNVYLRDIMTCEKAIRTDVFRQLPLRARGFDIEAEITTRLLERKVRIFEVPATYCARGHDEGKKLTTRDGVRVLATLVRCRLSVGRSRGDGRVSGDGAGGAGARPAIEPFADHGPDGAATRNAGSRRRRGRSPSTG